MREDVILRMVSTYFNYMELYIAMHPFISIDCSVTTKDTINNSNFSYHYILQYLDSKFAPFIGFLYPENLFPELGVVYVRSC